MINCIVAVSNDGIIGDGLKMPWHIPTDLKYFKTVTNSHTIVMGRATYDSIGRPLPNRLNVVLSKNKSFNTGHENVLVLDSIEHIKDLQGEVFIIGGGQIYEQTKDLFERLYITRVNINVGQGIKFADIDNYQYRLVQTTAFSCNGFNGVFEVWSRTFAT